MLDTQIKDSPKLAVSHIRQVYRGNTVIFRIKISWLSITQSSLLNLTPGVLGERGQRHPTRRQ